MCLHLFVLALGLDNGARPCLVKVVGIRLMLVVKLNGVCMVRRGECSIGCQGKGC